MAHLMLFVIFALMFLFVAAINRLMGGPNF